MLFEEKWQGGRYEITPWIYEKENCKTIKTARLNVKIFLKIGDDWKADAEKWDNLCRKTDSKRMAFCGETQKEMYGEQGG